jgi:hypothetical protein
MGVNFRESESINYTPGVHSQSPLNAGVTIVPHCQVGQGVSEEVQGDTKGWS